MKRTEAYEYCHEMMMLSPQYSAVEGAKVTYVLTQISDESDSVTTQSLIINPALPDQGTPAEFVLMGKDQQIAVSALPGIAKLLRQKHDQLLHINKQITGPNPDTGKILKQLQAMLFGLQDAN